MASPSGAPLPAMCPVGHYPGSQLIRWSIRMRLFSWTLCTALLCTFAACGESKEAPNTDERLDDSTAETEAGDAGDSRPGDCGKLDCETPVEADPCASVRCAEGTRCELDTRACKDAPCPAAARCVPAQSEAIVSCAQLSCDAGSNCVEDAAGQGECVAAPVAVTPVTPVTCGQNTCAADEECCNADCGLCAVQGSCASKSCATFSANFALPATWCTRRWARSQAASARAW